MAVKDPLGAFPAFARAVSTRLEAGRREYGDRSFSAHPAELCSEVEQELLDICGWSYVLWCRLRQARAALVGATALAGEPSATLDVG